MSPPPQPVEALLLVCCLIAAAWDLRVRRIPNWLVLSGLICGFALNGFLFGTGSHGLLGSLLGFGLALLLYLPLYLIRAMGAGDVKLMAAIGSLVGAANWLVIFFSTAIIGGLLALLLLLSKGRARRSLWNVSVMLNELAHFRAPYLARDELDVKSGRGISLPHGFTILLGTLTFLYLAHHPSLTSLRWLKP